MFVYPNEHFYSAIFLKILGGGLQALSKSCHCLYEGESNEKP